MLEELQFMKSYGLHPEINAGVCVPIVMRYNISLIFVLCYKDKSGISISRITVVALYFQKLVFEMGGYYIPNFWRICSDCK
jgi:hypothetical protein